MVRYDKSTADKGSRYVEDRRTGGRRMGGGGGRPVALGGGLIGIIVVVLGLLFGVDLSGGGGDLGIDAGGLPSGSGPVSSGLDETVDPDADTKEYLEFLMFDIQDTWDVYFDQAGLAYQPTSLVLFDGAVSTGCGQANAAVGPFYCPAPGDNKVYIDLSFYDQLSTRFGAPGDFAQAYVIAHEVGHHIQSVVGISDQVRQAQSSDPGNANEYSIRLELQADCLAGVWAHSANQRLTEQSGVPILEEGDIEEGLAAAAAVGDDMIQSQSGLGINPETWTHGSAEQRVRWFKVGFNGGDPEECDPFATSNP
ncbi:MAG: zinc metallopeptidase [Acidimicrobiia bacterium]|nr:zinc metallopeptidase [Acidimicrobiia bacterium]